MSSAGRFMLKPSRSDGSDDAVLPNRLPVASSYRLTDTRSCAPPPPAHRAAAAAAAAAGVEGGEGARLWRARAHL